MHTRSPIPILLIARRSKGFAAVLLLAIFVCVCSGCARFRKVEHGTVYVTAQKMFLHDRVAAVSNRVAVVVNGDQLEVLETGTAFSESQDQQERDWLD